MRMELEYRINERSTLRIVFTELIPETLDYDKDAIRSIMESILQIIEEVRSK